MLHSCGQNVSITLLFPVEKRCKCSVVIATCLGSQSPCQRACVCVCVCERERVCVCVRERERERERESLSWATSHNRGLRFGLWEHIHACPAWLKFTTEAAFIGAWKVHTAQCGRLVHLFFHPRVSGIVILGCSRSHALLFFFAF